jgi:hypothetical protein
MRWGIPKKKKPAPPPIERPRSADERLAHFDPLEALILERLMEAGWRVGYTSETDPDAHFWGVGDLVVRRTSTANRAFPRRCAQSTNPSS